MAAPSGLVLVSVISQVVEVPRPLFARTTSQVPKAYSPGAATSPSKDLTACTAQRCFATGDLVAGVTLVILFRGSQPGPSALGLYCLVLCRATIIRAADKNFGGKRRPTGGDDDGAGAGAGAGDIGGI